MNVEDMEKMAQKAVAKHVIQGWENLEDETGNAIAFSSDKALELFQKYPDFYNIVKDVAGEAEIFRTDEMEEAAGNSDGASDGTSTGESTNASS
jgi:recombinational DNA repair protein RecT